MRHHRRRPRRSVRCHIRGACWLGAGDLPRRRDVFPAAGDHSCRELPRLQAHTGRRAGAEHDRPVRSVRRHLPVRGRAGGEPENETFPDRTRVRRPRDALRHSDIRHRRQGHQTRRAGRAEAVDEGRFRLRRLRFQHGQRQEDRGRWWRRRRVRGGSVPDLGRRQSVPDPSQRPVQSVSGHGRQGEEEPQDRGDLRLRGRRDLRREAGRVRERQEPENRRDIQAGRDLPVLGRRPQAGHRPGEGPGGHGRPRLHQDAERHFDGDLGSGLLRRGRLHGLHLSAGHRGGRFGREGRSGR